MSCQPCASSFMYLWLSKSGSGPGNSCTASCEQPESSWYCQTAKENQLLGVAPVAFHWLVLYQYVGDMADGTPKITWSGHHTNTASQCWSVHIQKYEKAAWNTGTCNTKICDFQLSISWTKLTHSVSIVSSYQWKWSYLRDKTFDEAAYLEVHSPSQI